MSEPPGSNPPRPPRRTTLHGFEQLAGHLGVPVEPEPSPAPVQVPEDASDTELFPTLRAHHVEASAADDLLHVAQGVADRSQEGHTAATPKRGRGRRSGPDISEEPPEVEAVPRILETLGLEPLGSEEDPHRFTLAVDPAVVAGLPPVPAGYGFKGGVARKVLARTLGQNAFASAVRDIDLLRTADTPGDEDHRLASLYMPDDLTLGEFGIEVLSDVAGYMGSRELTVNQLVLVGEELTLTHACLLDTLGLTLRVTGAHLTRTRGFVHPGVALKALRFAANLMVEGGEPRVLPFRVTPRRMKHGFDFYFALHLSRVYENGPRAADVYLRLAAERGFLKRARLPDDATASSAARILQKRLAAYHLDFPDGA